MKELLIVAPCIILNNSVASIRMTSLIRYLDQFNYKIHVLTNEPNQCSLYESPNLKYHFVKDISESAGLKPFSHNRDQYVAAVKEVLQQKHFNYAIVSMGPFYTNKLASVFKKNKIRVVMDFRDPWVFDIRDRKTFFRMKNLISLAMKIPMERSCVHAASSVVTVSEGWVETFKKLYPFEKKKFKLIKNGYDDAILDKIAFPQYITKGKNAPLTLGTFGKLFYYTREYSLIFLNGVKECTEKCSILQIGEQEPEIDTLLNETKIPHNFVTSTGFMPYDEGMKRLHDVDAFLLIDNRKHAIGTKIYDYTYFGKPIIYVGPRDSKIASIVSKLPNGILCSTSNEVTAAINKLYAEEVTISENRKEYSRSKQNAYWRELLESENL